MRGNSQRWVRRPRPNPDAGVRLVCLPYSGGRASAFNGLAAELPDDVEVCAIELPGHGRRLAEAPLTHLPTLVEQVTDVIAEEARRPFVLLGYSIGALISFEVTRELVRHGWPGPIALFVAAARAPHLRSTRPPLHELSRTDLVQGLHRLAGHHNELLDNQELVDVMLPVLRADLGLDETYAHQRGEPIGCPIATFGGNDDWTVPRPSLEAWREHTTGDFSVTVLPGSHFFLDSSRGLFAEALAAEIERPPGLAVHYAQVHTPDPPRCYTGQDVAPNLGRAFERAVRCRGRHIAADQACGGDHTVLFGQLRATHRAAW